MIVPYPCGYLDNEYRERKQDGGVDSTLYLYVSNSGALDELVSQ